MSGLACWLGTGVPRENSNETTGKAIFEVWNGSMWALHYANPPAGQGSMLIGAQCLASDYCVAGGIEGTYNTSTGHGLTWFWNGGKSTLVNAP